MKTLFVLAVLVLAAPRLPAQAAPAPGPSPTDLAWAAMVLSAEPGTREPDVSFDDWPRVRAAVLAVAVEWELMIPFDDGVGVECDPESGLLFPDFFARPDSYQYVLDLLRDRRQQLADAPMVEAAGQFVNPEFVTRAVEFNDEYRTDLTLRTLFEKDREKEIEVVIAEADALREAWYALQQAQKVENGIYSRRLFLITLRKLIGEENFRKRRMPPYVPLWRFNERGWK